MAAAFISYRRDDSAGYAGRLHEGLEQRLGSDQVFRDVDSLRGGQDFVDTINVRLAECRALLAVISRQWLNARTAAGAPRLEQPDDYVALEIAAALERRDVLVVPVLVGGATMPEASQLPERIRALARRHAVALRDETWEEDVDRLAAIINRPHGRRRFAVRRRPMVAAAVALAAAAALLAAWQVSTRDVSPGQPPAAAATTAYAIDVPALAEAAHGSVIYSLISGSVHPRGETNGVRLRFRVTNEGFDDAKLWDDSFRLGIDDQVLAPTSGLNTILPRRSIRQAIVTFTVPAGGSRAALRILGGNDVAEVPLDLTPTGRSVEDEKADAADAPSRARLAYVLRDERPLVDADGFSARLLRVTSRLFVNKLRIRASVRMANKGSAPLHSGVLTMRLASGGELAEPVSAPDGALQPGATLSDDFVFEISPAARQIELRASAGSESTIVPMEVR